MSNMGDSPLRKSGRGNTIADRIAAFRSLQPNSPAKPLRASGQFWWQQKDNNDDTESREPAPTTSASPAQSKVASQAGTKAPNNDIHKNDQASTSTMPDGISDLLGRLSSTNPSVYAALMSLQRDQDGKLSLATLNKVKAALDAANVQPHASNAGQSVPAAASVAATHIGAEDSEDSLQAALSRYRVDPGSSIQQQQASTSLGTKHASAQSVAPATRRTTGSNMLGHAPVQEKTAAQSVQKPSSIVWPQTSKPSITSKPAEVKASTAPGHDKESLKKKQKDSGLGAATADLKPTQQTTEFAFSPTNGQPSASSQLSTNITGTMSCVNSTSAPTVTSGDARSATSLRVPQTTQLQEQQALPELEVEASFQLPQLQDNAMQAQYIIQPVMQPVVVSQAATQAVTAASHAVTSSPAATIDIQKAATAPSAACALPSTHTAQAVPLTAACVTPAKLSTPSTHEIIQPTVPVTVYDKKPDGAVVSAAVTTPNPACKPASATGLPNAAPLMIKPSQADPVDLAAQQTTVNKMKEDAHTVGALPVALGNVPPPPTFPHLGVAAQQKSLTLNTQQQGPQCEAGKLDKHEEKAAHSNQLESKGVACKATVSGCVSEMTKAVSLSSPEVAAHPPTAACVPAVTAEKPVASAISKPSDSAQRMAEQVSDVTSITFPVVTSHCSPATKSPAQSESTANTVTGTAGCVQLPAASITAVGSAAPAISTSVIQEPNSVKAASSSIPGTTSAAHTAAIQPGYALQNSSTANQPPPIAVGTIAATEQVKVTSAGAGSIAPTIPFQNTVASAAQRPSSQPAVTARDGNLPSPDANVGLSSLDISKGWPAGQPHGLPVIVSGIAGARSPMIFVPTSPTTSPTTSRSASPDPSKLIQSASNIPANPTSPMPATKENTKSNTGSPVAASLLSPTHVFVPTELSTVPRLLSVPGHPSFPLPEQQTAAAVQQACTQSTMQEAGMQPQCKTNNVPAPSTTTCPTPALYNISSVVAPSLPCHTEVQPVQPTLSPPSVSNNSNDVQPKPATSDCKNNAQLCQPQGSFTFLPQNAGLPPHDSGKEGPQAAQPAPSSRARHESATVTASPSSEAGHSTTTVSSTIPISGLPSKTEPANNAASVGSVAIPTNKLDSIAKGTTRNTSPTHSEAKPVNAPSSPLGAVHTNMQGAPTEESEAARRARDIVSLESRSPQRSRLTRIVEEVESARRKAKEEAMRRDDKAKLQKMKWEELEGYLGAQAAAVQDIRKLNWDLTTLKRDCGSVPPKQLAQQVLQQAEALRGAAIASAVQQMVQDAGRQEQEAGRDAELLHHALEAQHALHTADHMHNLSAIQTIGAATHHTINLASSYPRNNTAHGLTFTSRSPSPTRQAGNSLDVSSTSSLADPGWYAQLLAQAAQRAGSPAMQMQNSPSRSSSNGTDDSGCDDNGDSSRKQGKKMASKQRKGHGKNQDGSNMYGKISGNMPVADKSPVTHITEAARSITLQLESALNLFLTRTSNQPGKEEDVQQHHGANTSSPSKTFRVQLPKPDHSISHELHPSSQRRSHSPTHLNTSPCHNLHTDGCAPPQSHSSPNAAHTTTSVVPSVNSPMSQALTMPATTLPPPSLPQLQPLPAGLIDTALVPMCPSIPALSNNASAEAVMLAQQQAIAAQHAVLVLQQELLQKQSQKTQAPPPATPGVSAGPVGCKDASTSPLNVDIAGCSYAAAQSLVRMPDQHQFLAMEPQVDPRHIGLSTNIDLNSVCPISNVYTTMVPAATSDDHTTPMIEASASTHVMISHVPTQIMKASPGAMSRDTIQAMDICGSPISPGAAGKHCMTEATTQIQQTQAPAAMPIQAFTRPATVAPVEHMSVQHTQQQATASPPHQPVHNLSEDAAVVPAHQADVAATFSSWMGHANGPAVQSAELGVQPYSHDVTGSTQLVGQTASPQQPVMQQTAVHERHTALSSTACSASLNVMPSQPHTIQQPIAGNTLKPSTVLDAQPAGYHAASASQSPHGTALTHPAHHNPPSSPNNLNIQPDYTAGSASSMGHSVAPVPSSLGYNVETQLTARYEDLVNHSRTAVSIPQQLPQQPLAHSYAHCAPEGFPHGAQQMPSYGMLGYTSNTGVPGAHSCAAFPLATPTKHASSAASNIPPYSHQYISLGPVGYSQVPMAMPFENSNIQMAMPGALQQPCGTSTYQPQTIVPQQTAYFPVQTIQQQSLGMHQPVLQPAPLHDMMLQPQSAAQQLPYRPMDAGMAAYGWHNSLPQEAFAGNHLHPNNQTASHFAMAMQPTQMQRSSQQEEAKMNAIPVTYSRSSVGVLMNQAQNWAREHGLPFPSPPVLPQMAGHPRAAAKADDSALNVCHDDVDATKRQMQQVFDHMHTKPT